MISSHTPAPTAIVLGTTYSGSGAVFDYLASRTDSFDPLLGKEYLLPQSPYGLMSLSSALGDSFHHSVAHHAAAQFLWLAKRLYRTPTAFRYGKGFENHLPTFMDEVHKLIEDATAARFPFNLEWNQTRRPNHQIFFLKLSKKFLRLGPQAHPTWLPVSEDVFISLVQHMHQRLFEGPEESGYSFTLLNQAGSGWNPLNSTVFFANRKVIVVTRDPRDQFAELKTHKGASDVHEFIKWYQGMQERMRVENPNILILDFETFVRQHEKTARGLCEFIGIDPANPSGYSPANSMKNIEKHHSVLGAEEIKAIEKHLTPYLRF